MNTKTNYKNPRNSESRQYGIDIARLSAMFMVVLLHNLLQGGILDWTLDSAKDLMYMTLENYAIIAVNVFALISGYLGVGKPFRPSKLIHLWVAVFTWSAGSAIFGLCIGAQMDSWFYRSFFPVLGQNYWYFNSFILLELFVPILNAAVARFKSRDLLFLAFGIVVLSVVLGFPNGLGMNRGYSAIWLIVLWLVGASTRLNWDLISDKFSSLRLIFACIFIPLVSTYFEFEYRRRGMDPVQWIAYVSPLVSIQSICFFILVARIEISSRSARTLLKHFSPSAFGVYLIDCSNWFYGIWLVGRFKWILEFHSYFGVPIILLISTTMFICFLFAETIRINLNSILIQKVNSFRKEQL